MMLLTWIALSIATYTDISRGVIPNLLTCPAILIAFIYRFYTGEYIILLLPLLIILCFLLVFMMSDGIGGGDVKLFILLSLTVGFSVSLIMICSFVLAGIYGCLLKKKEIRLAPFIAISYLILSII